MLLAAAIIGQAASQSAAGLSDDGPDINLEVFARNNAPFDAVVLDTLRNTDDVAQVSPTLRVEASAPVPRCATPMAW